MCENLKEKNIPLLDQVIEDNQIGNEKVKKRDLKKVFDYFKKDQTVIIGTRFDLNMYFRTFICTLIISSILTFVVLIIYKIYNKAYFYLFNLNNSSYITFNGKHLLYVFNTLFISE